MIKTVGNGIIKVQSKNSEVSISVVIYFYKFFQLKPLKIILKHSKQFNFAKDVVSLQSIVQGKFKQKKVAMSYLNHVYESVDMVIDNPCAK